MTEYQPTSRRPIAEVFRATARTAVALCVRFGVHPDAVSYGSIVAATGAAVCFWRAGATSWLVIPAALLCYVRLWLNMLDGMVALAAKKASLRGEILNDLPDRVSDVLIFVGVAHSGWCITALGYWGAIAAVLTAYVGTFGQAVGVGRQFGGVMAKPWRMVVLHIGSWVMLGAMWSGRGATIGGLTLMDWALLVVLAGCVQTIGVRLRRIMRLLNERAAANAGEPCDRAAAKEASGF